VVYQVPLKRISFFCFVIWIVLYLDYPSVLYGNFQIGISNNTLTFLQKKFRSEIINDRVEKNSYCRGILYYFSLVFAKVCINARKEYQKVISFSRKDYKQAIIHFNQAIHWYSPGSKAVANSIQALWKIGTHAETQGDINLALDAFQSIASSLYSARSFYTPHQEWIANVKTE